MSLPVIILGAVGILFLLVGVISGVRTRRFLDTAAATQGTVVGFEERVSTDSDGDRSSSTHAVVAFASAAGMAVTFTEKSQTLGGLDIGSAVPVKYDKANPEKARIATGGRLWVNTIVIIAIGVVLLIIGVVVSLNGG